MTDARPGRGFAHWLGILALVWFAVAMVNEAMHKELLYDDAYNASVAHNFSLGLGWVTSYHEQVPFNPRVSSGPTLLLPLAAATPFFGTPNWLPSLTTTLLMLTALALCLSLMRRLVATEQWPWLVLACLLLLSLYDRNTWVVFIGDGLLALLLTAIFLAFGLLICEANRNGLMLLGLLCGLAILTKIYAVIALSGLAIAWLLYCWQNGNGTHYRGSLWLLVGAALPVLPWQWFKTTSLAQLSPQQQQDHTAFSQEFFMQAGSGLGPLSEAVNIPAYLMENAQRNFALLAQHLDANGQGTPATGLLLCTVLFLTLHLLLKREKTACDWSLLAMGLGLCAHFAWFLLIMRSPWIHYARIPVILSVFFMCLTARNIWNGRIALSAAVLLALALPVEKTGAWWQFASLEAQHSQGERDLDALIIELPQLTYKEPLVGCGWLNLRMLEYRLPGHSHLKDCMMLVRDALPPVQNDQGKAGVTLTRTVEFTLPLHKTLWNWAGRGHPRESTMREFCTQTLYSNSTYALLSCRVETVSPELAEYLRRYRLRS